MRLDKTAVYLLGNTVIRTCDGHQKTSFSLEFITRFGPEYHLYVLSYIAVAQQDIFVQGTRAAGHFQLSSTCVRALVDYLGKSCRPISVGRRSQNRLQPARKGCPYFFVLPRSVYMRKSQLWMAGVPFPQMVRPHYHYAQVQGHAQGLVTPFRVDPGYRPTLVLVHVTALDS